MSTYVLRIEENMLTIQDVGYVPCRSKALGFFKNLSEALKDNRLFQDIDHVAKVVSEIQIKIERSRFYRLVSYIPFTEAYVVSKLLASVKMEIQRKQEIATASFPEISTESNHQGGVPIAADEALETPNIFKYFDVSLDLINKLKELGPPCGCKSNFSIRLDLTKKKIDWHGECNRGLNVLVMYNDKGQIRVMGLPASLLASETPRLEIYNIIKNYSNSEAEAI